MKRIIAGLLVLILTLGLAACGSSKAETTPSQTEIPSIGAITTAGEFDSAITTLLPGAQYERTDGSSREGSVQYEAVAYQNPGVNGEKTVSLAVQLDDTPLSEPWTYTQLAEGGWSKNSDGPAGPGTTGMQIQNESGRMVFVETDMEQEKLLSVSVAYGDPYDRNRSDNPDAAGFRIQVDGGSVLTQDSGLSDVIQAFGTPDAISYLQYASADARPNIQVSYQFANYSVYLGIFADLDRIQSLKVIWKP